MNEVFNQLMLGGEVSASEEQRRFLKVHNEIMYCGNMAGQFVVELARNLKKMKDAELYTAAGFSSFGEYAEDAVGIKERQAYNYIKILDEFTDEFLQSNAKLGITKLSLLASAPEEIRSKLTESEESDEMTVRELKARIEELEREKEQHAEQLSMLETEKEDAADKLKKTEKETQEERKKTKKLEEERDMLKRKIEEIKSLPPTVEKIENPETAAELEKTKKALSAAEEELAAVTKKLEIAADQNMVKFKVKFEDLQTMLNEIFELLAEMEQEKKTKCKAALRSVMEGYGL